MHYASISVTYGTHRVIYAAEMKPPQALPCGAPKVVVSLVVNPSLRSCTERTKRNSVWQSAKPHFVLRRTAVHCGHYGPHALIHHCPLVPVNRRISDLYYLQYARTWARDVVLLQTSLPAAPSGVTTMYKLPQDNLYILPPIIPGPYHLESSLSK